MEFQNFKLSYETPGKTQVKQNFLFVSYSQALAMCNKNP